MLYFFDRGAVQIKVGNFSDKCLIAKAGDKLAQMIIVPYADCVLIESGLNRTARGEQGFGSSGASGLERIDSEENLDSVEIIEEKVTSTRKEDREQILDFDFLYQLGTNDDQTD